MADLTTVRVSLWMLGVDLAATRRAYASLAASGSAGPGCTCGDCRNFAATFPAPFPTEALALFEQLGLDARYPSRVDRVYRIRVGLHSYHGYFHFAGKLFDGEALKDSAGKPVDSNGKIVQDFEPFGGNFALRFTTADMMRKPSVFYDQQIVALVFETIAPWVLNEPEFP
jgi:hypothetical protein